MFNYQQNISGVLKRNKSVLYDAVLTSQRNNTDSESLKKELLLHSGLKKQTLNNCKYIESFTECFAYIFFFSSQLR